MPKAGIRSNASLLTTSAWTILLLTVLIGGHVLLALLLWGGFQGDGGMATLTARTGLHGWIIGVWIAAALVMDVWILHYMRKQRQKAMKR